MCACLRSTHLHWTFCNRNPWLTKHTHAHKPTHPVTASAAITLSFFPPFLLLHHLFSAFFPGRDSSVPTHWSIEIRPEHKHTHTHTSTNTFLTCLSSLSYTPSKRTNQIYCRWISQFLNRTTAEREKQIYISFYILYFILNDHCLNSNIAQYHMKYYISIVFAKKLH